MMNMSRPSANTGMLLQCAQITMRIYQDDVLGIVINKNQNHWMSFRMENDQIWNLDSLHQLRRVNYEEYVATLREYRHACAVRPNH